MIKIKDIKRLYERENKVSSDFGHFSITQAEKLKVAQIFRDAIGFQVLGPREMSLARKARIGVNHFGGFVRLQRDVRFSRAPVLSFARYFQAPATQARFFNNKKKTLTAQE